MYRKTIDRVLEALEEKQQACTVDSAAWLAYEDMIEAILVVAMDEALA